MHANPAQSCDDLKKLIREVPDFPKPGILFYDITTLLKDKLGFARLIDALTEHYINDDIDLVLGIEARGFIFGPALAYRLNAGFVPVRKPKKLPAEVLQWKYDLEYGQDTLEIHKDAIQVGPAHSHLRRPAGDRGHGESRRRNGGEPRRRDLRDGICGRIGRIKRPGQVEGLRRLLAAALRDVGQDVPLPNRPYDRAVENSPVGSH